MGKYKEAWEKELQEYNNWATSPEGQAALAKHREMMEQQKQGAVGTRTGDTKAATEADSPELSCQSAEAGDEKVSPAKCAKVSEVEATPQKHRVTLRPPLARAQEAAAHKVE